MKTRLLWALILSVGIAALYCGIARPHVSSIPKEILDPMADLKPVAPAPMEIPALVIPDIPTIALPSVSPQPRALPALSPPEVPIQNKATIDFSTGAPVVRVQGEDRDALEAALREIAEVAKGTKIEAKK
jgi:hypothetical protein